MYPSTPNPAFFQQEPQTEEEFLAALNQQQPPLPEEAPPPADMPPPQEELPPEAPPASPTVSDMVVEGMPEVAQQPPEQTEALAMAQRADADIEKLAEANKIIDDQIALETRAAEERERVLGEANNRTEEKLTQLEEAYKTFEEDTDLQKTYWESSNTPQKILLVLGHAINAATVLQTGRSMGIVEHLIQQDAQQKYNRFAMHKTKMQSLGQQFDMSRDLARDKELFILGQSALLGKPIELRLKQLANTISDPEKKAKAMEIHATMQARNEEAKLKYAQMYNQAAQVQIAQQNANTSASAQGLAQDKFAQQQQQMIHPILGDMSHLDDNSRKEIKEYWQNYTAAKNIAKEALAATRDSSGKPLSKRAIALNSPEGQKFQQIFSDLIVAVKNVDKMGANFTGMEKILVDRKLTGISPDTLTGKVQQFDAKLLGEGLARFIQRAESRAGETLGTFGLELPGNSKEIE